VLHERLQRLPVPLRLPRDPYAVAGHDVESVITSEMNTSVGAGLPLLRGTLSDLLEKRDAYPSERQIIGPDPIALGATRRRSG
jgi:hypothetical protein